MTIIDGRTIATEIINGLKNGPRSKSFLAAVLVGEDESSASFLKQKEKASREASVDFRLYRFPGDIKQDHLRNEILKIVLHKTCGGAIIQLPLPEHINTQYVLNAIPREKDVDVLGERALGAFYTERNLVLPPAVGVVKRIIERQKIDLQKITVAIVGLGKLVGRPLSLWLMRKTKDLLLLRRGSDFSLLRGADLIISGAGSPNLIKGGDLKSGAGVIDFGYNFFETKICGDLDLSSDLSRLSFYTPTPGGTGPILVASVLENFKILNSSR